MKRHGIVITLLDDCVFSARTATVGSHESLDRIPGQALLGAVAARLYHRLDRRQAFEIFHSGRLRFGDGLPFDGSAQGIPVPLAWHHPKTARVETDGRLDGSQIHNFLHGSEIRAGQRVEQPKQLRRGYVFPDGRIVRPATDLRLKTAIDPGTGRAAEGQLFGYESLIAGQRFAALIEADDDLDDRLFREVADALHGEVLLGRSRSAEYGRARIENSSIQPPTTGSLDGNRVTLWLVSDLALVDEQGQPTIEPRPEYFGLGGGCIVWEKTFLRSRRYSPWNAARAGYDRERLVLNAGGVISFEVDRPPATDDLGRLAAGVGLYREAGLGRVWVNPPLLTSKHPLFDPVRTGGVEGNRPLRPDHPLIGWLDGQVEQDWKPQANMKAAELARGYDTQIGQARRMAGIAGDVQFGPSRSQWGRILEAARSSSGQALYKVLFTGDSAIVKRNGEGWNIELPGKPGSLAEWLKENLFVDGAEREYAYMVRQLAHRVRSQTGKKAGDRS